MKDVVGISTGTIIQALRNSRFDGECFSVQEGDVSHPVEEVIVHTISLPHGNVSGVMFPGVKPGNTCPPLYQSWDALGLVGGVYAHPRLPNWYIREDTSGIVGSSRIREFLSQQFGRRLSVLETLQMIVRIYG